jgi:hypothetical protein
MMSMQLFATVALFSLASLAHADKPAIADISSRTLSSISQELGCGVVEQSNVKLGCSILTEFIAANHLGPDILMDSSGIKGRRWLGVTIISDNSKNPREGFQGSSPYLGMIILGARYSGNFHQKIHYSNGYSPTYFWPTSTKQATLIEQASTELISGRMIGDHPVVTYAKQIDLQFSEVQTTTGKSQKLEGSDVFLRQNKKTIYVIEIGENKEGMQKYYLSRVRLDSQLDF